MLSFVQPQAQRTVPIPMLCRVWSVVTGSSPAQEAPRHQAGRDSPASHTQQVAGSVLSPVVPPQPSDWPSASGSIFSLPPVTLKNFTSSSPKRTGDMCVVTGAY